MFIILNKYFLKKFTICLNPMIWLILLHKNIKHTYTYNEYWQKGYEY